MAEQLLDLEEKGWQALSSSDPVSFCETWLADDALVVVPGMVLDRATFLQALAHEVPWATHTIEDARTILLTDQSAALVYRVTAHRDGRAALAGFLTSVYVHRAGRWQSILHQQTPAPTVA